MLALTRFLAASLLAAAAAWCLPAEAAYPEGPVKIIVPFPPGGTSDVIARLIGQRLEVRLGHPFIIDNRPGAGGMIGAGAVAKAPPDGYTLLLGTIATHGINSSVYKTVPYDPVRDFEPVTILASPANVLLVTPSLPVSNLAQFIEYAKRHPGAITIGSTGIGGSPHMTGELLKAATGIDMIHVPYRGSAPMMVDLLGGQIQAAVDNLPTAIQQIRSGKVKPIAVTSLKRFAGTPDIPAMAETIPGFEVIPWYGLLFPAKTPKADVDLLYRTVAEILKEEPVRKKLLDLSAEPGGMPPEAFAKIIDFDLKKWKGVVAKTGLKPE